MIVIGLTGSIGMGKSTAAQWFRAAGIGVFDADGAVHALYSGAAVPLIEATFAGTTGNGSVDRVKLSAALGSNEAAFKRLEAIIHPLVRDAERAFLAAEHAKGAKFAVLEVPLLFETGADRLVDAVIVLSTDPDTQRARVLRRPGMTETKLATLLARQMPDAEKRARADFVVDTTGPVEDTHGQIAQALAIIGEKRACAYRTHWEF